MSDITEKNVVIFSSPGSFFPEESSRSIGGWSIAVALQLAEDVAAKFRTPYAFKFETLLVSPPIDDGRGGLMNVQPKKIRESGNHFIDGKLFTLEQIKEMGTLVGHLAANMEGNGWPVVVRCRTGNYQPFLEADFLVDSKTAELSRR